MALKANPKIYTYFTNLHRQTRCFFIHFILKDIAFFQKSFTQAKPLGSMIIKLSKCYALDCSQCELNAKQVSALLDR